MKEHTIEEWFHSYEKDVTSFLVYFTGSLDVEDYVQDTFLIALRQFSSFNASSHPKTWLISIARNQVIDRYRRKMVWERLKLVLSNEYTSQNVTEIHFMQKLEHNELNRAIQQLSPAYREVVILRGIMELSSKEASFILQCSPNKVNVMFHRSLKKLKMILEKEGFSYEG
ncbi:RNA polymerase sigma factor [Ornithinibacillus sp. FSL M8-0202]|uniref:RNA polymerase sigma factor n=1 Tax=unclassified Ornithinibacillus TaxID=2620869 RepID=UPI0030CDA795